MHIHELNYLHTIAQQQSISAAADKLNISQQRLSRILQNIEQEFQLTLFTRSKKGVALTKDGVQFMKYAQNMLTLYDDMHNIAKNHNKANHLICGIDKHLNKPLLEKLLQIFKQYPDVIFSFEMFNSAYEIIDALLAQKVHLALSISAGHSTQDYFYSKCEQNPAILRYPLATEQMYCIVHQDDELAQKTAVDISEIIGFPMTFCTTDSTYSSLLQSHLTKPINIFLETDSLELQLECINSHLAVGLLDGFALHYIAKHYPYLRAIPLINTYGITLTFYLNAGYNFPGVQNLKDDIRQMYKFSSSPMPKS